MLSPRLSLAMSRLDRRHDRIDSTMRGCCSRSSKPSECWNGSNKLSPAVRDSGVKAWIALACVRHCEEQRDEAIQNLRVVLDCFASLAMTRGETGPQILAARSAISSTSTPDDLSNRSISSTAST